MFKIRCKLIPHCHVYYHCYLLLVPTFATLCNVNANAKTGVTRITTVNIHILLNFMRYLVATFLIMSFSFINQKHWNGDMRMKSKEKE